MTLVFCHAMRSDDDSRRQLLVIADSRIAFDGTYLDTYIKTRNITDSLVAVMAGSSMPTAYAAEAVWPFVRAGNEERKEQGLPPMSLWDIAPGFIECMTRAYALLLSKLERPTTSSAVLAGFLKDGSPALLEIELRPDLEAYRLFRPERGGYHALVIGQQEYAPHLIEAFRRGRLIKKVDPVLSVFWDITKADHIAGVGGGINLGQARNGEPFDWPLIQVESKVFMRGIGFSTERPDTWSKPYVVDYDPCLFAEIDRLHAEKPLPYAPDPTTYVAIRPGKIFNTPNDFLRSEPDWAALDAGTLLMLVRNANFSDPVEEA